MPGSSAACEGNKITDSSSGFPPCPTNHSLSTKEEDMQEEGDDEEKDEGELMTMKNKETTAQDEDKETEENDDILQSPLSKAHHVTYPPAHTTARPPMITLPALVWQPLGEPGTGAGGERNRGHSALVVSLMM